MSSGEVRYMTRCIDKLGFAFRGDESLLDVGCGNGRVARLLAERVREVLAVDVDGSPEWSDGDGVSFQVADGEAPFIRGRVVRTCSTPRTRSTTMKDPARASPNTVACFARAARRSSSRRTATTRAFSCR